MAKAIGVWGIDIGQCALKAVRLELVGGVPTATAFDFIEHPKILSQPDADPDGLIRESLEKFLSRNPIGKDRIAISVPGQNGLVRFVKLPPVEPKKVLDIVRFEAKQQIPFPLEDVVWDHQKIAGGEVIENFAMETEIGLFAMKRETIAKSLAHYQVLNAEVYYIQMAPIALCNYATFELLEGAAAPAEGTPEEEVPRGKKKCAVVLDIGTDSSNLVITDGAKIIWTRSINLGGSNFTRALTKEMKLTFAKAEHLKRNAAKSAELTDILKALRPVLTEFVGEVQRSLGFFTNTHKEAHIGHMVGLGNAFRLPGLQKYLSEKLALEIKKPIKFDRLQGEQVTGDPTFIENVLTFPVAYGLALQGIGLARLSTNLLPEDIHTTRLIRAKKPYAAAAAAALLLGTSVFSYGYGAAYTGVVNPKVKGAAGSLQAQGELAKKQEATRKEAENDVKKKLEEVKQIVVGNAERLNWIRFQEILTAALPRHPYTIKRNVDGKEVLLTRGNLDSDSQRKYWDTGDKKGGRAVELYKQHLESGVSLEDIAKQNDDLIEHLANVDIEAVNPRYVENLSTFLDKVHNTVFEKHRRKIAEYLRESELESDSAGIVKPKIGEFPGWVVEIRGYTYHEKEISFVTDCLIKNLQNWDSFADATLKGANNTPDAAPKKENENEEKSGDKPAKEPDDKVSMVIKDATPAAKGKGTVSHVFLVHSELDEKPAPSVFKLISKSKLDEFISAVPERRDSSTPSGGGSGGPPAKTVAWSPVPGGAPAAPRADAADAKPKRRFEFIIFLVWREPLITDIVQPKTE